MITREGSLSKWTNVVKGWQRRWLVLDDNAGILSYYLSRDKMKKGLRRGCIPLKRAVVGIDNEDETNFTVTSQLKIYHFQARNIAERNDWVSSIEDTILRHAYGTRRKSLSFEHLLKPHNSIDDFNKKLHEADSYLQMVIEHTKAVSIKMDTLQETKNLAVCSILTTYANNFLDEVKHTIILLQIAKNTMDPANSVQALLEIRNSIDDGEEATQVDSFPEILKSRSQVTVKAACSTSDDENFFDARETTSRNSSFSGSSHDEICSLDADVADRMITADEPSKHPSPQHQTETSCRSKDDQSTENESEDDAYVQDVIVAVGKTFVSKASKQRKLRGTLAENQASLNVNPSTAPEIRSADGTINYDYIYENSEESEISIECSVVSHLISQVKIGMDLSKVVLPIFILEKRSLLEMYADFFAHPDVFVSISEQPDAKSRMVQLVKWYLSSFHAARKSDVAKKPYNPVLGEVFLCSWDLDPESDSAGSQESTSPSGSTTRSRLSFTAEQVSHHPPISAFYAECPSKRISCSSHIWTKSKFYGLSIGVINEGKAAINVFEYDEQYTVTFPNAYGRSILTKPWFELGGNVRIACEKTGYAANIEFLTKPFYGSKRHKIVGAILEPGATKPFVTLEGEWSGKIYARWLNGEAEVFSDVNEMTIFMKNVRSVYDQEDFESRKLWKDVTAGLWLNDISRATNAKIEIESRQRRQAQARNENGELWEARLFSATASGDWTYRNPLQKQTLVNES